MEMFTFFVCNILLWPRKKNSFVGNFGKVVLHHFEDLGKKDKFINGVTILSIPVKISWVYLWGNVGLWKKIQLANAKWNYDNLKRGDLKRFDPLDVQSYHVFLIV